MIPSDPYDSTSQAEAKVDHRGTGHADAMTMLHIAALSIATAIEHRPEDDAA